ncbi:MAG: DUF3037 domain-containing protein [Armatimonadetes bacterium]|nr:DUF3037 domain-containing protein [Armatimonadota bacterium]
MDEYTFCVLRYSPDRGTEEQLNIGVVLRWANGAIEFKADHNYARLTSAFAGVQTDGYRAWLDGLQRAFERFAPPSETILDTLDNSSLESVMANVVADNGLSIHYSRIMFGVSPGRPNEIDHLYRAHVERYAPERRGRDRITNKDLFDKLRQALPVKAASLIEECTLYSSEGMAAGFEYAYKNRSWHVVEPLSLDYLDAGTVNVHVFQCLGKIGTVADHEELGSASILIGRPQLPEMEGHYEKAVRHLRHRAPSNTRVYEERSIADLAEALTSHMPPEALSP